MIEEAERLRPPANAARGFKPRAGCGDVRSVLATAINPGRRFPMTGSRRLRQHRARFVADRPDEVAGALGQSSSSWGGVRRWPGQMGNPPFSPGRGWPAIRMETPVDLGVAQV
jgi:hypothetical protein